MKKQNQNAVLVPWSYDRYGNRLNQTQTFDGPPANSVTVSATTNRITDPGYSYDLNGNMTNDGLNLLTYDGENRAVSAAGATYTYDGNSLRVKKLSGTTTTIYVFSGTKVIAEYDNGAAPTSPSREYIYTGSQVTAKIEAGTTTYFHPDHLSTRVVTDSTGTVTAQQGHYPYGESWYASGSVAKWKFTTYERDTESGNDYAMMRSYVNRLARFSSPDMLAGSIADPQSLNRYAYTLNDPIGLVDPLGSDPRVKAPGTTITVTASGNYYDPTYYGTTDTWGGAEGYSFFFGASGALPIEMIFPGGASGGSLAAALLALKTGANTLTNLENLNRKECQEDLTKLGITADQLRAGASAANFINGVGSTVSLSSLYATSPNAGVRQAGRSAKGTVGDKLAGPGTVAVSQLGGPDIYVNPAMIDPRNYLSNLGTAFHEIVHNVSGLTDSDIQRALGIKEQPITHNITEKLLKDCF